MTPMSLPLPRTEGPKPGAQRWYMRRSDGTIWRTRGYYTKRELRRFTSTVAVIKEWTP